MTRAMLVESALPERLGKVSDFQTDWKNKLMKEFQRDTGAGQRSEKGE